jgi:hypothetical protein
LLSAVTIFASVAVVASDVADKQVFLVVTKPLARWQYILGRWLGIVVLDAVLLLCAGGAIYAFAQHLRGQAALTPSDRRAVETEVFTARHRVSPSPPDVQTQVERRVARLKDEGRYQDAVEAYKLRAGGDAAKAERMLLEQIHGEEASAMQSVGVGEALLWRFEGIRVAGGETAGRGKVTATNPQAGALRIQTPPRLMGELVLDGPVRVQGIDGQVVRLEADFFEVLFRPEDARRSTLAVLKDGSEVDLIADPTIQVIFKASPAVSPPDRMLPGLWQVLNPTTGFFYQDFRRDQADTPHTLTLSARLVDAQGRTEIRYVNVPFDASGSGTSVTILSSDVTVLCRVGSFEGNFAKAMVLVFLQLVFLAAVGVFAGTFLSFSVACLVAWAALLLGMIRDFITAATTVGPFDPNPLVKHVGGLAVGVVKVLLPDLARTNPSEFLVGGMNSAWAALGQAAATTVGLRGLLILAMACLIFSKRELARVQV